VNTNFQTDTVYLRDIFSHGKNSLLLLSRS